jgi:hypothetical protein
MHGLEVKARRMRRSVFKLGTAAVVAGLIVFLASGAPKANAPKIESVLPPSFANAERHTAPARGAACSQQGWPNFEHSCQFDLRQPASEARAVRVIALR